MLCTSCLQGHCSRHPLLDHGKRASELQKKVASIDLKAIMKSNIKAQIERLEKNAKGTSKDDIEMYKEELENNRNDIYRNSRDNNHYSNKKSKTSSLSLDGLCPSVRSVMIENENSESDDNDEDDDKEKKTKKRKKEKKKKEKKEKKEKKQKKDKKKRERDRENSESDSSHS